MSRHDPRRQRFLLQGPIEELREDRARRRRDEDETRELVDELEQILSGRQAALPSPRDFDGEDEPPFAPRDVVAESYDPYEIDDGGDEQRHDEGFADDGYYDELESDVSGDDIEAVDYWVPAPNGTAAGQRRLPPPPPDAPARVSLPRRVGYFVGIAAIFVVAAAGAYFAFRLASDPVEPVAETALTEPGADEPVVAAEAAPAIEAEPVAAEPPPIIVNVERIDPRVPAEPDPVGPAAPANGIVTPEAEPAPAGPVGAAAPFAPAAEPVEPAPAAPAEIAAAVEAPAPVVTAGPVTDFGVTTAWVNLRTGPSNAYPVVGVVAVGTEVGIVACERWCAVEANGNRGWIHGDFIRTEAAQEAAAELAAVEPNAAEPAAAPAAFTANTIGGAGIYDSPFEDGAVAETVRGEILVVGCDVNWCETRYGAGNRRGWVARAQVRIPENITDDLIPPLPPISREEAAALRAAAL
jgi:SH3-like domain-containing protein